jgi:hypothetical protein
MVDFCEPAITQFPVPKRAFCLGRRISLSTDARWAEREYDTSQSRTRLDGSSLLERVRPIL